MTRPLVRMYWFYLQKMILQDLERQAILFGYKPRKTRDAKKRRELAERWQADPLFGFPNDIEYFDKQQIQQKLAVSARFWKRMKPEARWDRERGEACAGRMGVVARRCSMNDKLWGIFQKARRQGVVLTLESVKKMILIDIKRSKLYPPGWKDDTVSPPQWYVDELRGKGLLDQILAEIDEATGAKA